MMPKIPKSSTPEFDEITYKIISCCFAVYNNLGLGYTEKDYQKALVFELEKLGLKVESEYSTEFRYESILLRRKRLDLLIENEIVIELKINCYPSQEHLHQLLSYLHCTNKKLGLLIYFTKQGVEKKRVINTDLK